MATLGFNRLHKNGWVSFKLPGVPGAVFIDKRMFEGDVPTSGSITVEGVTLKAPGAGATEADAEKQKARLEKEAKKAEKAAAAAQKAQDRLKKLQEQAEKAKAAVEAAKAKSSGSGAEATDTPANL
jgi:predicted ribosome quality control (RQC) complex YloA/Tae2 family protein